jgi:outer membrane protein TolC
MRLALLLVGVLFAAWPAPARAEEPPSAPAPAPTTAPAPPPVEPVPLSLADAIALGIENNTNVQVVRFDPPIAAYDYDAAWGLHDPEFYGGYSYRSTNLPVASTFFPSQFIERESAGDVGFRGLVPRLGWTYQLGYVASGLQTNSRVQTLGTTYTSSVTLALQAPLLRGAWWGAAWTQVQLTGIESQLALQLFRQNLMDIVAAIERGYWNLAATKQGLEVANKSLEAARALLERTEAQYDVGVVSRVEVTEAEAGVADREFQQIATENLYRDAQDELIDAVYGPRLTPTSRLEIEPTDLPEAYVTFALDPTTSTQRALERRPELQIAQQQVEQAEVSLKFAKNQRLPQLDAIGSYGTHGLSGNDPNCPFGTTKVMGAALCQPPGGAPPEPLTQPPNIGTDFHDNQKFYFDGNDNRVWTAGAIVSIPIPNTTARANVSRSELALRKASTNVRRVEQDIVKGVRNAVRELASALEGVEAAERRVKASEEQLRAERIRLEHGESTPFEVLLREEDLVEAERQQILALRDYRVSVTALDRAQGTLLEDRSIVLEDAMALR